MPFKKVPGEAIRKLRQSRGWHQKEACCLMDISQQAYSKIERRPKVTSKMVNRILIAFGSNPEEIEKYLPPPRKLSKFYF